MLCWFVNEADGRSSKGDGYPVSAPVDNDGKHC